MTLNGFANEFEAEAFGLTASSYCRKMIAKNLHRNVIVERLYLSGKAANRSSASAIYCYVTNPPKTGGRRKFVRSNPGDTAVVCPIEPALMERLQKAADARDVAPKVLAQKILATVLADNMIDAVLDDRETAA